MACGGELAVLPSFGDDQEEVASWRFLESPASPEPEVEQPAKRMRRGSDSAYSIISDYDEVLILEEIEVVTEATVAAEDTARAIQRSSSGAKTTILSPTGALLVDVFGESGLAYESIWRRNTRGFRNHYTEERVEFCPPCLRLALFNGHQSRDTPVPFDCACRAVRPVDYVGDKKIHVMTRMGVRHEDIRRDGGADWGQEEFEVLVYLPMKIARRKKQAGRAIKFVAMLPYWLRRQDLIFPCGIWAILDEWGIASTPLELYAFLREELGVVAHYNLATIPECLVEKVSRVGRANAISGLSA